MIEGISFFNYAWRKYDFFFLKKYILLSLKKYALGPFFENLDFHPFISKGHAKTKLFTPLRNLLHKFQRNTTIFAALTSWLTFRLIGDIYVIS